MKRCLSIIGLALCVLLDLSAQGLRIKDFSESQEIFLGREQRRDLDGVTCALVRVVVPADSHVRFTGNVIGEVEYDGNEYRVYLSEGSRYLRVHHPGCAALLVDFQSWGYDGVESKKMYELVLGLPDGMRRTMSRSEYERLIARAALQQKEENFAEAVSLYEDRKRELIAKGEQGYANEVQERINYCKRRITFKQLKADRWRTALSEGLCCYRAQGKLGFVDSIGNVVVPPIYEDVLGGDDFKDGIAWVKKDSLWGSINTRGEVVIPYTYKYVDRYAPFSYEQNRCVFISFVTSKRYQVKVVDYKTGQEILPDKYSFPYWWQTFDNLSSDYFCLEDSKGRAIFFEKKSGKEIGRLTSKVRFHSYLGHGFSLVYRILEINDFYKEERLGIVNKQGDFLLPCEYRFESLERTNQFIIARHYVDDDSPFYYEPRIFNLKQQVFVGGIYDGGLGNHIGNLVVYGKGDERGVLNYVTGMEIAKIPVEMADSDFKLPQMPGDPITIRNKNGHTFLYDAVTGEKYEYPRPLGDFRYGFAIDTNEEGKKGFVNVKGEIPFGWFDHVDFFKRYGDVVAAEVYRGNDHYYITSAGNRIETDEMERLKQERSE